MSLIKYIRDNYVLFILGNKENIETFCMTPFEISAIYIDPLRRSNKHFVDLLIQLDGLGYGDKKLAMDKWVALDCGMLPSAFIGLAKRVHDLDDETRAKFDLSNDYNGLVPVTMYCAIPASRPGCWIGHSLVSVINGKGLGLATKVIGLRAYNARYIFGIAQYNNSAIKIHSRIKDLRLASAITFAHSITEMTFVYEHEINKEILENAINKSPIIKEPSFLLRADDLEKKMQMQECIERGVADYFILYPGQITNGSIHIPILERKKNE